MGTMATISRNSPELNGAYVIDIEGYDQDLHDYLINRGAVEWTGWVSVFAATKYPVINFPGYKPFHHNNGYTRLFMPGEDEALLFVLTHGHLIRSTHIRAIKSLMKETNG
jgi:hypothetical protein